MKAKVFPQAILFILFISFSFLLQVWADIDVQNRERGVSVYLVPENVEKKVEKKTIQRFIIASSKNPGIEGSSQTAEALMANLLKSYRGNLKYGIWLVLTNPISYSEKDDQEKANLEALAHKHKIPLYVCRGMNLPNGWKQVA